MKTIHITSQDELPQVAGAIIGSLGRRTVVAFRGEMGAGKTTLIREIAAELGAADTVTSPTFAIVRTFPSKVRVTFQVGLKNFKLVSEDDFFIGVSYEELVKNKSDKIELSVKKSPDFVNHIRIVPAAVDYLIEQQPEDLKADSIDD